MVGSGERWASDGENVSPPQWGGQAGMGPHMAEGGVLESRLRMNGQRAREEARWLQ